MTAEPRTGIVGGGMAGCSAARELLRAGRRVTLFEASAGLGGRARSWHRPDLEPDVGFNLWYSNLHRVLGERIREYGLEAYSLPVRTRMHIVSDGRSAELVPSSLRSLLTYPHVTLGERLRFLAVTIEETARRRRLDLFEADRLAEFDDGTTAADWARSRLSPRVLDNLIRPELEAFWLWRCEDVSAAHARAMQANVVGARFSILTTGLEPVAERMAEGADVRLGARVENVAQVDGGLRVSWTEAAQSYEQTFDELVLAVTGPVAADLVRGLPADLVDPRMVDFAGTQRYEPVVSVCFIADRGLMPSGTQVFAASTTEPAVRTIITVPKLQVTASGARRERELLFVYLGREATRELLDAPDDRRFEVSLAMAPRLWPDFPRHAEPYHTTQWRHGLPWPEPGRYRRASALAASQHPPVVLAGDFLSSPTVESAIRTGVRAAATLLRGHRAAPSTRPRRPRPAERAR